jgi:exonuclease VII large subunit
VHGTAVKKTPALTDDDIALLAPRPAANPAETPKPETAAEPATKATPEALQDPEKRQAEVAALQQQIKEKQRKIELLMRMFVLDEEAFLKDPSGQSEEEEARAKRKFEQDELLREGKEIAQLRARLEQIAPPGGEKAAPAKGVAAN